MPYQPQHSPRNRPGRFLRGGAIGVKFQAAVAGFFTVSLLDAKAFRERGEEVVKRRLHFQNLITDQALNRVCDFSNQVSMDEMMASCWVGTGSTAPAVSDTDLATYLAGTTNNSGFAQSYAAGPAGAGPGAGMEYTSQFTTRVFMEAEANGNLTEVAMAQLPHTVTPVSMWTRQLFLDEVSAPTTITKTSAELLKVEYEVRVYPPTAVVTQAGVTVGAQSIDVTIQPIKLASGPWTYAPLFGSSQAVSGGATGYSAWAMEANADLSADFKASPVETGSVKNSTKNFLAYVPGSFTAKVQHIWDLGVANFATGIGSLDFGSLQGDTQTYVLWYMRFVPKILKTSSDKLTIEISYTLARH